MPAFFLDSLQLYVFYSVMFANNLGRFHNLRSQVITDDKVKRHIGIMLLSQLYQFSQCRTIGIQIGTLEISIFVLTDRSVCPIVIDSTEDEDDIRIPQTGNPCNK